MPPASLQCINESNMELNDNGELVSSKPHPVVVSVPSVFVSNLTKSRSRKKYVQTSIVDATSVHNSESIFIVDVVLPSHLKATVEPFTSSPELYRVEQAASLHNINLDSRREVVAALPTLRVLSFVFCFQSPAVSYAAFRQKKRARENKIHYECVGFYVSLYDKCDTPLISETITVHFVHYHKSSKIQRSPDHHSMLVSDFANLSLSSSPNMLLSPMRLLFKRESLMQPPCGPEVDLVQTCPAPTSPILPPSGDDTLDFLTSMPSSPLFDFSSSTFGSEISSDDYAFECGDSFPIL